MTADASPPTPDFAALKRALAEESNLFIRTGMERLLALLEEAGRTSITAACKSIGVSRPTYYERKRKFESGGCSLAALRLLARPAHPDTTTEMAEMRICALARLYPHMPSDALARELAKEGIHRSGVTVRKILNTYPDLHRNLRPRKRPQVAQKWVWRADEEANVQETASRASESRPLASLGDRPRLGAHLVQSVFMVRCPTALERVYVHAVINKYSGHVWSRLARVKGALDAALLVQSVCHFYLRRRGVIQEISTSARREFRGPDLHGWADHHNGFEPHRFFRWGHPLEPSSSPPINLDWIRMSAAAGVDWRGDPTAEATSFMAHRTTQHRTYQAVLRMRGVRHDCPKKWWAEARANQTVRFDEDFERFATSVRESFFAPWRAHQKVLAAKGEPTDDFETLQGHFEGWVARYNDSLPEVQSDQ